MNWYMNLTYINTFISVIFVVFLLGKFFCINLFEKLYDNPEYDCVYTIFTIQSIINAIVWTNILINGKPHEMMENFFTCISGIILVPISSVITLCSIIFLVGNVLNYIHHVIKKSKKGK